MHVLFGALSIGNIGQHLFWLYAVLPYKQGAIPACLYGNTCSNPAAHLAYTINDAVKQMHS